MRARGGGAIVNVIGHRGKQPDGRALPASVANAGLMNFTVGLAQEEARHGIRVVGINPAPVDGTRRLQQRDRSDRRGTSVRIRPDAGAASRRDLVGFGLVGHGHDLELPGSDVDLWREKRFDIILDDQWVAGAFDRVAIVRGRDGRPLRATVLDFKSDEIASDAELADAAERYRSQLLLYQSALSWMLELDPSQVTLQLLFTHPGKVHDLK